MSYHVDAAAKLYEHYFARGQAYWERSPEIKKRFPVRDRADFWRHIDVEAILYIREIQDVAVAFPPWREMSTVGGETDLRIFLGVGRDCYDLLHRYMVLENGRKRILDFGVGCGRTARHFYRDLATTEMFGCDVDGDAIRFLDKQVEFIHADKSNNLPPLDYGSEFFDYVYSISVFTNLNEVAFRAWSFEIARVLVPGGKALITLHGSTAIKKMEEPGRIQSINVSEENYNFQKQNLESKGFFWAPQIAGSSDIDTEQYGISFLDERQLANFLPPNLEVETYEAGAISGWQDLVVLRKI